MKQIHHLSLRAKNAVTGFLFTLPALVGLGAFFVVPFGITMKMSLTESMGSSKFVGLKNYRDVLKSAAFKLAAKNTFKFFSVALPCILILSLLIALLLFRNLKKYDIFRTFFVFPLVLPVSSVVLFFQIVFSDLGVVNGVLEHLGMHAADWTGGAGVLGALNLVSLEEHGLQRGALPRRAELRPSGAVRGDGPRRRGLVA